MKKYGLSERFFLLTDGMETDEGQKEIWLLSIEEFQESRMYLIGKQKKRYIVWRKLSGTSGYLPEQCHF